MQIIELYIRDGIRYYGNATSTSSNNLVDVNADFTTTVKVGYIAFNEANKTSAKITAVTNSTTLALSADIFEVNQPYAIKSDYQRLDLFNDESVSITDSIKNVKDVAKIFTPFSQQFNIPASKHNSKIIRHYEDSDILNSFDARYKADALIKLNGSNYKKGKIRLNSVSLKNNKPHAYKLIFFGETVDLKDLLGETMLSGLNYDSDLNFTYNHATIYPLFEDLGGDVCFPLITHTKNMRYNNSAYRAITPTSGDKLNYRDLKPALRIRKIIEAIQNTFDEITFTGEFFNSEDFNSIYMWMHREKGFMSNADEAGGLTILENLFHLPTDEGLSIVAGTGDEARPLTGQPPDLIGLNAQFASLRIRITTSSTSDEFDFRAQHGYWGDTLFESIGNTGSTSYTFVVAIGYSEANVRLILSSTNTFNIVDYEIDALLNGVLQCTYQSDSFSLANTVVIGRHMPKIKVIDFLTNMFKMFNLVAFKDGDNINVLPLNDFYEQGLNYDITKYVDTTKNSISKVLQYKNIDFNFPSKESFLVKKSDELQGANFAGESYGDVEWDGTDYKIEPVFEKMLYERLSDETSGTLTTICQGAMLDKDFNATIGQPLLLYVVNQIANPTFAFANADGGSDETVSTYNRPSQILVQSDGSVLDASSSLNFGIERDEFFLDPRGTNLLEKYYLDYVESVFNRQSRINKVDAYLPLHIILNYNLNDKFIIGNKSYRINSIKTNLLTNKSSLELYSLAQNISTIENDQTSALGRLASISISVKSSDFITITWTTLPDPVANNITGYDLYLDNTFQETLANTTSTKKVTGLQGNTTYKFAIRVRYTISSSVVFSNDTIVFGTTDVASVALSESSDTLITELGDKIILE